MQLRIGLRRRRASNRPRGNGAFRAQRELAGHQLVRASLGHYQHDQIGGRPPIWKPTLPPSIRTVPGADHPDASLVRQDRYPFPYLPPTTNAAVLRSGTMTMQCALEMSSCGTPLSGVAIISDNTAAASSRRWAGSLSTANSGVKANVVATVVAMISFTMCLFCWRKAVRSIVRGCQGFPREEA